MSAPSRVSYLRYRDGSRTKEIRLAGNRVETRTIDSESDIRSIDGRSIDDSWWQLTPSQLSAHVMQNTAVARWLESRMGWRRLLRACVGEAYDIPAKSSSIGFHDYQSVG